jgi:hypothetical protein
MYPILTLQAAAVGLALLVSISDPPIEKVHGEPQHALRAPSTTEPVRLHCRVYFGCAPAPGAPRGSHE